LYEIRAATSFEVRALHHLQLLHTVPRWRKIARNIISDNKLRQPCAKPEDILNASIQVIICMTFEVLMVSGYRHTIMLWKVQCKLNFMQVRVEYTYGQLCRYVRTRESSWNQNSDM